MSIFTFLRSFKWGAVLFLATVLATAETSLWHVHEGRQVRVEHITDEGVFVRSAVGPQAAPAGGMLRLEGLSREVALKGLFVPRTQYLHGFSRREEDGGKSLFTVAGTSFREDWIIKAIKSLAVGSNTVLLAGFFEGDALNAVFWSPLAGDSRSIWHGRHNEFYPREKFGRMPLLVLAYDPVRGVLDLGGNFSGAADFVRAVWMDDADGIRPALSSRNLNRLSGRGGWELAHWVATVPTPAARRYLREARIDPRRADSSGWTLLHHAAAANNPEAVRVLLDHPRTRIDAVDAFGFSPLAYAASVADETVVEVLLTGGASPTNPDPAFACPLQRILYPPRAELADLFLRHHKSSHRLWSGVPETHLIRLITLDQPQLLRVLSQYGQLRLEETYGGRVPIAEAAGRASVPTLEFLVGEGVSLEPELPNGVGLLHLAAASNARVIPWLIARGLDPNAATDKGENPLFVALRYRNKEAVTALLTNGATPNSMDPAGQHLLWLATEMAEREAVTQLVEAGAVYPFTPKSAFVLMEDAFRFDIPEVFEMSLAQVLVPEFAFPGGFPGWGVAGRYGAERIQEAFRAAGLPEAYQQELILDSSAEVLAQIRIAHASLPPYPAELQSKYGLQRIRVDVIIDREGRARFPILVDNPVPELADEFLAHFRSWRFDPLELESGVHGVRAILPIRLEVDDENVRIYESGDIARPPRPLIRTQPRYPPTLREARISGEVIVHFVVSRDGTVDRASVVVLQASHPAFIEPTEEAIAQWRFEPGVVDNQPVNTRVRQRIPFQLN